MTRRVVFLVNPDSESQTGDKESRPVQPPPPSKKASKKSRSRRKSKVQQEEDDDDSKFNYSVQYMTWAVSSSEEDSDEEMVPSVTLPLRKMSLNARKK